MNIIININDLYLILNNQKDHLLNHNLQNETQAQHSCARHYS